jgi:hypothetical protein
VKEDGLSKGKKLDRIINTDLKDIQFFLRPSYEAVIPKAGLSGTLLWWRTRIGCTDPGVNS